MAGEKLTRIVLGIFLLLFIALTAAIGLYIVGIYRGTTSFTNATSARIIGCVGYALDVRDIGYENSVLRFTLRNMPYSDYDVDSVVVESKFQQRNISLNLPKGEETPVVVENFDVQEDFFVYVPDCRREAKKCSVVAKEC